MREDLQTPAVLGEEGKKRELSAALSVESQEIAETRLQVEMLLETEAWKLAQDPRRRMMKHR